VQFFNEITASFVHILCYFTKKFKDNISLKLNAVISVFTLVFSLLSPLLNDLYKIFFCVKKLKYYQKVVFRGKGS